MENKCNSCGFIDICKLSFAECDEQNAYEENLKYVLKVNQ